MRLSVINELNSTGDEFLKNARNAAAGAVRNLDPKVTARRRLDCFFYDIGYISGKEFASQEDILTFMRENGFPASELLALGDIDTIIAKVKAIGEGRASLDYLIDGAVVKINNIASRKLLGYTDRFPRGEIAFKFPAEEQSTTVLDIKWEVGRTGKLTPIAELEPVDFNGVTVKRATLNNIDDIKRKHITVGALVAIRRSNDVIPEILYSIHADDSKPPVAVPSLCPECKSRIEKRGVHSFCTNSLSCKPQIVGRLEHFASRNAMDIDGFSEKTAKLLVERIGLSSIPQLYELTQQSFMGLRGFGEKRVNNILAAIENSKHCQLPAFIFALGIPNVGAKTARDLADSYGSLEAIINAEYNDLCSVRDIGDVVANSIVDFFHDATIRKQIDALLACGVAPIPVKPQSNNSFLQGKTFVITGTFTSMTRTEIEAIITNGGGVVSSSVSGKTSFLVAGEKAGSKLDKARTLCVTIINEEEFFINIGKE